MDNTEKEEWRRKRCPKCNGPMDTKRIDAGQCRKCRQKQQSDGGNKINELKSKIFSKENTLNKIEKIGLKEEIEGKAVEKAIEKSAEKAKEKLVDELNNEMENPLHSPYISPLPPYLNTDTSILKKLLVKKDISEIIDEKIKKEVKEKLDEEKSKNSTSS